MIDEEEECYAPDKPLGAEISLKDYAGDSILKETTIKVNAFESKQLLANMKNLIELSKKVK